MADLLTSLEPIRTIKPGLVMLARFALPHEAEIIASITHIAQQAPLRTMITPGGHSMSVAMTNCGTAGWVTDAKGYRYTPHDSISGKQWPVMPDVFSTLATTAAHKAGFPNFTPDACLINRYAPKAKMSLHQDKDEQDMRAPIVSVSLGLPATFMFGGLKRTDPVIRIPLTHGDVVVWGGTQRLAYHGIAPVKEGMHSLFGNTRINLTFRKTG